MDVHRPKAPIHGWREFLKEVGIIVLGVLIALAAEQAAEALHHRETVRHGEDALRDNFARFVGYTAELDQEAPCATARIAELRAIIDKAALQRRLPRIAALPQPYARPWQIDTWDAMVASQAAVHLPKDRAVLYSRIAMSGLDLYNDATTEWAEWGALRSLSGAPRPFSEAEEAKARDTLARAENQTELVRFIARHTVVRIRDSGLIDRAGIDQAYREGLRANRNQAMCRPIVVADR